jgi:hypothetical protein
MQVKKELTDFYVSLSEEISSKTIANDAISEDIFTETYIDHLVEAAEVDEGNLCFYEPQISRYKEKINAFSMPESDTLILFVSIYKPKPEVFSVPPSDVKDTLKKLKNFYTRSCGKYFEKIDPAYPVHDAALTIYENHTKFSTVKLICLTNGTVRDVDLPLEEEDGVTFVSSIWDLERIYRVCSSGKAREKIVVDLIELTGKPLTALRTDIPKIERTNKSKPDEKIESGNYSTYLTTIPGKTLFHIYEKFNARLLEKNVRAFLQAKGGVNRGIRTTILETPEMFLAYNNGISATAESVDGSPSADGCFTISKLHDFQIVNGGQTTASIYDACQKSPKSLDNIFVQAKITVIGNKDLMDEVVPQISRCANTQNKVQMADFSANDPFHQAIEALSRTVWAPAKSGKRQTRWFFERSRGQYADTRAREKNKNAFDLVYPKKQYFDKLELARFENLWEQLPHITSKGGQTGFHNFMIRLKKQGNFTPTVEYFEQIIAKAILYRSIRRIVKAQNFLGFWVNISDYTFAFLNYKTSQRLDLSLIWKDQDIPSALETEIEIICRLVNDYLISSAQGKNTTQWCKQEACWDGLKKVDYTFPAALAELLVPVGKNASVQQQTTLLNSCQQDLIQAIASVDPTTWFSISSWGKQTKSLQSYQNSISYTLGVAKSRGKAPSIKQSQQGLLILKTAVGKGFIQDAKIVGMTSKF